MSREPAGIVLAPIKYLGLVDGQCFTNITDFIKTLQENLVAEVPDNITNVHVGNIQPSSTERNSVWFRVDTGGKFIGIYMFDGAVWQQVLEAPNQVTWMFGDSNNLPAGFILVDGDNPNFDSGQVTAIQSMFYPTPGTPPYSYFAVTWVGF